MYSLQLVLLLAVIAAGSDAFKLTPELEKCAVQALHALSTETNAMYKTALTKILKDVQNGHLAEGQKTLLALPEADRLAAADKYLTGDCAPLRVCLDCPIEL